MFLHYKYIITMMLQKLYHQWMKMFVILPDSSYWPYFHNYNIDLAQP